MFFRSERLFLRPIWPEDWEVILTGIADEAVVRNLALAPWPYGEKEAREFARLPQDPRHPHCLIVKPLGAAGSQVIGCIGLAPHAQGAELGYWITRAHWGHGYATEAARAMLTMARVIGHRRMVAHHFIDNPASGRVLARLGFRPTGALVEQPCLARGHGVCAVAYALALEEAHGNSPDDGSPDDGLGAGFARRRAA